MSPFGSPNVKGRMIKRGKMPEETRVVRLIHHGSTGARVHRQGRWRDQSPLGFGDTWMARHRRPTIPPLAPLREARLNGFPEALAVVPGHPDGRGRRHSAMPCAKSGVADRFSREQIA